ncbi:HD domain-containing protein [Chryseobacterium sp. SIMBA_028]|uniref:HD domain-containing protein n=1 Tax=Chryseobacterium sp. SIMBA_028 TaxID=3085771 RepID=UPI00397DCC3B
MDRSEIIQKITEFADQAHGCQTRKYTSERYIVHPLRVMEICHSYTDKLSILAAAVLHDVIEDTPLSKDDISQFLGSVMNNNDRNLTVQLVVELTDVYTKKDFPTFNRYKRKKLELERLREISTQAQTIKYADIIDNSIEIPRHDPSFSKRYLGECRDILFALDKGNLELHRRALALVVEELGKTQRES